MQRIPVSVLRAFSLSVAKVLMLLVWEENIMCVLYVMPKMVGVLLIGRDCHSRLDSCQSGTERVIKTSVEMHTFCPG